MAPINPEVMTTLSISCFFFLRCKKNKTSTVKVKMLSSSAALGKMLLKNNSQVTRAFNSLVGTSEAIRLLAKKNKKELNPHFNE